MRIARGLAVLIVLVFSATSAMAGGFRLPEAGVEKIHQGICLRLLFPLRISPGDYEYCSLFWSVISVAP